MSLSDEAEGGRVKVSHCGTFVLFSFDHSLQAFRRRKFYTQAPLLVPPTAPALFRAVSLYLFLFAPLIREKLCRPTLSVVVKRSRRTSALTYCCIWPQGPQTCGSHLFSLVVCISTQEEETYPPGDFFFSYAPLEPCEELGGAASCARVGPWLFGVCGRRHKLTVHTRSGI